MQKTASLASHEGTSKVIPMPRNVYSRICSVANLASMTIRWYGFVRWTICVWTPYRIQNHTHTHTHHFRRNREAKIGTTNIVENDDDLMEFTHKNLSATILMAVCTFANLFIGAREPPFKEANVLPPFYATISIFSLFSGLQSVQSSSSFLLPLGWYYGALEMTYVCSMFWAIHLST